MRIDIFPEYSSNIQVFLAAFSSPSDSSQVFSHFRIVKTRIGFADYKL
jgi:hypothetical protein